MKQILKADILREDFRFKALVNGKKLELHEPKITPEQVGFGYKKRVSTELHMFQSTPFGQITEINNHTIDVMTRTGTKKLDKKWLQERFKKTKFVLCETGKNRIDRYELIHYIQLSKPGRLKADLDIETFVRGLQDLMIKYLYPLDTKIFLTSDHSQMHYSNKEITRENFDKGRKYKKLVFARQVGLVLTKLFYPEMSIAGTTRAWGYKSHQQFFHNRDVVLHYLSNNKVLTGHILNITNMANAG